jgi:hypothetical protein
MTDKPTVTDERLAREFMDDFTPDERGGIGTIDLLAEAFAWLRDRTADPALTAMQQASDTGDDDAEWLREVIDPCCDLGILNNSRRRLNRIADRLEGKAG